MSGKDHNPEWFAVELARSQSTLYAFANTLMAGSESAWDVLQEANLVMCRKAGEVDGPEGFLPWAYTVVRYQVMAHQKKHSRDRHLFSEKVMDNLVEHAAGQSADFGGRIAALKVCMEKLSEYQRQCLSLRYVEAMSLGQIAEQINRRENAVAAVLYRARLVLAECVEGKMQQGDNR